MEQQKLDWSVEKLTKNHVAEMEKLNKFEPEDLEQHYDTAAANYEGIYMRAGYPDPSKVSEMVAEMCDQ